MSQLKLIDDATANLRDKRNILDKRMQKLKDEIEKTFNRTFSNKFNIHRTRINFPNKGLDNFDGMAEKGVYIVDRVVQEQMGGGIDLQKNTWYIPIANLSINPGS